MKKSLIISLLIFISSLAYSQVIGVNFSSAVKLSDSDAIPYEKLIKLESGYIIPFKQTVVGLKHCIEAFGVIMSDNKLDLENIVREDMILASYVDGLDDYENLNASIRAGSSEVVFSWIVSGYIVSIVLDSDTYAIFFSKK